MKAPAPLHDVTLERYRLGELPPAEADAVRDALEADPASRVRLAALASSDAEILAALPPLPFAAKVERRLAAGSAAESAPRRASGSPVLWLAPLAALGLTAAIAGSLVWKGTGTGPDSPAAVARGGDRLKGGSPSLLLFRQGPAAAIERLEPGALAHAHEVVQIAYHAGGRQYGVILSIDGRGVVTRHLPASGDQAARLQPGDTTPLDAAYRLDDAPRAERFYLVAADAPFEVSPVLASARRVAADPLAGALLPLGPTFVQASFLLRKE
jgi:hypothetical protein